MCPLRNIIIKTQNKWVVAKLSKWRRSKSATLYTEDTSRLCTRETRLSFPLNNLLFNPRRLIIKRFYWTFTRVSQQFGFSQIFQYSVNCILILAWVNKKTATVSSEMIILALTVNDTNCNWLIFSYHRKDVTAGYLKIHRTRSQLKPVD